MSRERQVEGMEGLLSLTPDELLARLNTTRMGLSSEEAEDRLRIYGPNELAQRRRRTVVVEFLYHLGNPLVVLLMIAGLISISLGELMDATIIFAIVLLSIFLDVYQEAKAETAAKALKERVTVMPTVVRDGAKKEVKLPQIVPGDVVVLSAGDIVPADARVLSAKDFFVDQSALTGESFPLEKTETTSKEGAETITEWDNIVFFGTSVVSGTATAAVVSTGTSTEYGKISQRLVGREHETEFERGLRRFGFMMMEVTLLLVMFVFFINAFFKRGVLESLIFSVALAVGLTPELLPMIISVNLSKGAMAMSRKGVIVKRLASIENFGSMDVLCTDKTGTLTENKITLVLHVDTNGDDDDKVLIYSFLNSYYETGLRSPLDDAILRYKDIDVNGYRKIDEVPFDFTRRRVSIVAEVEGRLFMATKGAPEEVLRICTHSELKGRALDLTEELKSRILQMYYKLSSQGFRVLGVCYREFSGEKTSFSTSDEAEMTFIGFVAFLDPPKESAKESLSLLEGSAIELKILTGDNELVTRKVCEQLGFEIKSVVLGSAVSQMNDDALERVVETANVFTRVTPGQKDRIMAVLKRNGHVVGFLGDGINDAPSLKRADVGLSVDNAVDVAKESADIILLNKDLTVLTEGVLEGRRTFGNTVKYIMMGTSSNFGNMSSVAGASLFLPFLPMLPLQILLNNFLYDLSELAIPTDNVDREYVETPKKWDVTYIRNYMTIFGPISSVFDFITFFIMLTIFNATPPLFQTAWFIESLATQTLVIFVIRTRKTPFYASKPSRPLLFSSLIIVALALVLPFTPLGELFEFVRPPPSFYIILTGLIGVYLLLVEAAKIWFYRRYANGVEKMGFKR